MMKPIRKIAILLAAATAATLASPAVGQPQRGIKVGEKIVPRQVETMQGERVTVPAGEGRTVLLFWSTWSPRSSKALDLWQRYGDRYRKYGVTVLAVNADNQHMGEDDVLRIRDYVKEAGVTFPVILDSGLELFNEIGVIVLPTTLLFTSDGTLEYKYAGLPSSAELDLKEDLEARLGIAPEPEGEKTLAHGPAAYQPRNNALLFYNMGKMYEGKGLPEKAKAKYIESLQRDLDFEGPLRALEGIFFADGKTPESVERLGTLLTASGLGELVRHISDEKRSQIGDGKETDQGVAPLPAAMSEQSPAPAITPVGGHLSPTERMRLLMERSKEQQQ